MPFWYFQIEQKTNEIFIEISDLASTEVKSKKLGHLIYKVLIFWEGHKILRNLHLSFDWHYIGQKWGGDFPNFVAFSEYMKFTMHMFLETLFQNILFKYDEN